MLGNKLCQNAQWILQKIQDKMYYLQNMYLIHGKDIEYK